MTWFSPFSFQGRAGGEFPKSWKQRQPLGAADFPNRPPSFSILGPRHQDDDHRACACLCVRARAYACLHMMGVGGGKSPTLLPVASRLLLKNRGGVPIVAQKFTNPTSMHEDASWIPGLAQWVKDPELP